MSRHHIPRGARSNAVALAIAVAAAAATLAGCGGGGGDTPPEPPPSNTVPASATASSKAYTQYTASLAPTEVAEPLLVDHVMPPVSDSDEPLDV